MKHISRRDGTNDPLEGVLFYGLMAQETHDTAERVLDRLVSLYHRYPSPELGEAIWKVREWRDTLRPNGEQEP